MAIFSSIGQTSAVTLSVHPRTTKVLLQQGAASNVLVGYVRVQVHRATMMSSLAVQFTGDQNLDMRDGQGPSSAYFSIRRKCADITHTVADCATSADGVAAAVLAEMSRVRRASREMAATSPPAFKSYAEEESHQSLTLTSFSSSVAPGVELRVGEYRFMFELELPSQLPSSVQSPLGRVAYQLQAVMRRPARLFQSAAASAAVGVQVIQVPRLQPGSPQLHGFASFAMLASTPLLFEAAVGAGWKVSVCSPSSQALFVGSPLKLQVFLTRNDSTCSSAPASRLALAEFGVVLHETITHKVPGSTAAAQTTERVVASSSLCPWSSSSAKQQESCHVLDPQTVNALGESFNELPSVGALNLWLPQSGPQAVQPTTSSPIFSVSHRLAITVSVCEDCAQTELRSCSAPSRVSFASKVLVLPEALASGELAAQAPLPCYSRINSDVVLETTELPPRPDSGFAQNPPAYAALYKH